MSTSFEQIKNSRVLLRADLNEALNEKQELTSTKRIDAAIQTIQELLARNNRVVLITHHSTKNQTLAPIAKYLHTSFPELFFIQNTIIREVVGIVAENTDKNLIMLENIRSFGNGLDEGNDDGFAKELSSLGEYFVFDAFSVAHREHASVVGVPKYIPHCLGMLAQRELDNLSPFLNASTEQLVIFGGAKLSTKIPIVKTFLKKWATVFLGGAMAHPILKARGVDIKNSVTEDLDVSEIKDNINVILPIDFVWSGDRIVDAGPDTIKKLENQIKDKNLIFWNGPLGYYEGGFDAGTDKLIEILNQHQNKKIVVGGGDTLTVLEKYPDFKCSYISLSGGAMLEFLINGELPGITANKN